MKLRIVGSGTCSQTVANSEIRRKLTAHNLWFIFLFSLQGHEGFQNEGFYNSKTSYQTINFENLAEMNSK